MLHNKTNPKGLDTVINTIQETLYSKLGAPDMWNLELEAYPRCYVLEREGEKTIEHYNEGKDYSGNLVVAEGNKFFFVAPNDLISVKGSYFSSTLDLFFVVNVEECKPGISHRGDEEVRLDVINILRTIPDIVIKKVVFSYFKVFLSYGRAISQQYDSDFKDDMHPYHFFRVELDVLPFDINKEICNN